MSSKSRSPPAGRYVQAHPAPPPLPALDIKTIYRTLTQPLPDDTRRLLEDELYAVLGRRALSCWERVLDAASQFQVARALDQYGGWERAPVARLRQLSKALLKAHVALARFFDPQTRAWFAQASGSDGTGLAGWGSSPLDRNPAEVALFVEMLISGLSEMNARILVLVDFAHAPGVGRRADAPLRRYIQSLAPIYEAMSGTLLAITHHPYQGTGRPSEGFRFLQACVRPFDPVRCEASAFVSFCQLALSTKIKKTD